MDGRVVTGSADDTAKVWDAESGRELLTLRGHNGSVGSAVFSPDGRRILTEGSDGAAKFWDAENGRQLLTLKGDTMRLEYWVAAAISRDGRRIATGGDDNTAAVWMAASPEEVDAWRKTETSRR